MQESMYAYMKPGIVHFKAYPQVMEGAVHGICGNPGKGL